MSNRKRSSFNQRQLVVFHHAKGKTHREIADLLNMKRSTVGDIIRRFNNEDRIDLKCSNGRPKILTSKEEANIIRKIKINPRLSAPKLVTEVKETTNKDLSPETIRRVIRKHGFNGRIARKKPFVNATNRKRRIEFAKMWLSRDEGFWKDVIFADESKFNIFGSDGRVMVWRKPGTELNPKHLRATVKHGGGSVMVWGCMSAAGTGNLVFIDGIMTKFVYLNILRRNLRSSARKLGIIDTFSYYQDNDPKHKSNLVQSWLLGNCPNLMETPAQSPDCNPIEHLWEELDRRIRKRQISNEEDLKKALQEEWQNIPSETTKKLVESMPKRLEAVINNKGYPTKY